MVTPSPEQRAEIRALLAERRLRLYGQARFTAAGHRAAWRTIHVPRTPYTGPDKSASARASRTPHTGAIGAHVYTDDGTRLARSVIAAASVRYQRRHPTEKPLELLDPLIRYACPPGGLVVDSFAGSGSTLDAARQSGRRAIGVEADERYCEAAARRLSDPYLIDLFNATEEPTGRG